MRVAPGAPDQFGRRGFGATRDKGEEAGLGGGAPLELGVSVARGEKEGSCDGDREHRVRLAAAERGE
jgi:hypothetical protein